MVLIKLGEAVCITANDLEVSSNVENDPEILKALASFQKTAAELKLLAPKAKDFLYFSAIMMHAAEASALNADGSIKVGSNGEPVKVGWDNSNDTWKWTSSDPSIMPYRNANRDIFPESELLKAYKLWVGRPLCLDHKSASVDFIRGVIVDTYYDRKNKRVIALCALDKVNYPDLARKVSTGYATSVSMGTAVGRAICTTCANAARIESEFCNHMRERDCYGEINTDLNPIELSIVVNGADPQAKIKHIVAAANALSTYTEMKQQDLNKLTQHTNVDNNVLAEIKASVADISDKLAKLESEAKSENKEDKNDASPPYGISGSYNMKETELPATDQSLTAPTSLQSVIASVHTKLDRLQNDLNNVLNINKENKMTTPESNVEKKAYYQGTEEPTPGKPKYPKEEADKIRDTEDKQMLGQSPFPGTGPVDGMHPGVESSGESEEARKKRLQRMAEANERSAKRAEAVAKAKANLNKSGYYQGTEEPKPGTTQYPKEDADKIRDKEDKQMVGQSPFPGVGKVDDLHPSPESADIKDELKRKEMLSRAALKAKFVKAAKADGTEDKGSSMWQVFAGDKLILTTTVNEIVGKNPVLAYEDIATKPFGMKILDTIKTAGFDKAKSLFKSAQEVPAASPMPTPDMGGLGGAPTDLGATPPAMDESESGDPAKRAHELAQKALETVSDLEETIDVLTGEQAELSGVDELGAKAAEEINTNSLQSMRKFLNASLVESAKESVAALNEHQEELKLVENIYSQGKVAKASEQDKSMITSLTESAITSSEQAIVEAQKCLSAFLKYARGTEALESRIAEEVKLAQTASPTIVMPEEKIHAKPPVDGTNKPSTLAPNPLTGAKGDPLVGLDNTPLAGINAVDKLQTDKNKNDDTAANLDAMMAKDEDKTDKNEVTVDLNEEQMKNMLEHKAEVKLDLATKEGRAEYRAKLAQKGAEWSDMVQKAHPKGGHTTELDVKPTGDLAKVETITEVHDKMMGVAEAPPKVKKAAEDIQRAIVAGQIDKSDVDGLEAHGLDPAAIKYWKQFFGMAPDGGSEFANELVKTHAKAKVEEAQQVYQVKIARAYDLAYDMANRGMCLRDASAIKEQVEQLMQFNDKAFESLKNVVARQAVTSLTKQASIPQVGILGGNDILMPSSVEHADLRSELEQAFGNKRY